MGHEGKLPSGYHLLRGCFDCANSVFYDDDFELNCLLLTPKPGVPVSPCGTCPYWTRRRGSR